MDDISNPFAAPTQFSNVVLIVEGNKLHVNKEYVAAHSGFLAFLLYNYHEGKEEVPVNDVNYEEFLDVLKVIHLGYSQITDTSVHHILKLAQRFKITEALYQSNTFLNACAFDEDTKQTLATQFELTTLRNFNDPNRFASPTDFTNVIIVVEGRKLHVSKQYLAIHSGFFASKFFGDFAEKEKEEVELEDVVYEEFLDLLHVIHPGYSPITDSSLSHILKLADRFAMKGVLFQSEIFLSASKNFKFMEKLVLSDQFNLQKLKDHCITRFRCVFSLERLKASPEFCNFSDATKVEINDRIDELKSSPNPSLIHFDDPDCVCARYEEDPIFPDLTE